MDDTEDFEIEVIGDFNTDPIKTNHYYNVLLNFICKNELFMIDTSSSQYVDYSFKNLKRSFSSWFDHILVEKANQEIGNCHILVSAENKSDHNPISTTYRLDNRLAKANKQPKRFLNLEWNKLRSILKFQERVNDGIDKLDSLECELGNEKLEKQYQDDNKQFGYKPKSSCSHAIFALKQSVALIKNKNRRMYVAAINASNDFDKVKSD
ncbi:unnamed protein product [Brachionus calyciflorus]|uniref:Endonuclease/exonuclease/phosphatase domain-containing protein n=1 Tax=Brachionus calyciflorus TaxID=104777 RepID=A0A814EBL0_9BILA|nr:unnamed protein product [Brachionus calyciflorus]